MIKKYGARNTSEGVFKFKYGKASVTCRFCNGNLQSREPIPATYSTNNPLVQRVIETSEQFLNGKIFILAEYAEVEKTASAAEKSKVEKTVKPADKKAGKKTARVFENVTTLGEAVTILSVEGANSADLMDEKSILKTAENLNITFPNLKN